jgi:hypothetical protein
VSKSLRTRLTALKEEVENQENAALIADVLATDSIDSFEIKIITSANKKYNVRLCDSSEFKDAIKHALIYQNF